MFEGKSDASFLYLDESDFTTAIAAATTAIPRYIRHTSDICGTANSSGVYEASQPAVLNE